MTTTEDRFADATTWRAEFANRLMMYETLLEDNRRSEKDFEAKREAEFAKLRDELMGKLAGPAEQLYAVAPINARDVDAMPTRRAAYSDRTAAIMAKLANLAYIGFEDSDKYKILEGILGHGKLKMLHILNVDETDLMIADAGTFMVVAFRGSTSRQDFRTDLQSRFNVSQVNIDDRKVSVPVHGGFYAAYRKIETELERLLAVTGDVPIYLTGHSLGGALALVASAALSADPKLGARIAAVYTFGAPRVGTRIFAEIVKAPHYRVVNSGDLVPLLPPTWLRGYAHTGMPVLLRDNANLPIHRSPWGSALVLGLASLLLWPFTRSMLFRLKHDSSRYVANLERIAKYRGRWT